MKIDWKKDASGNPINQEFYKADPVSARVITGGVALFRNDGSSGSTGDFIVKDGGDDEIIISKEEFNAKFITKKQHEDKINGITDRRLKDKIAEIKTLKSETKFLEIEIETLIKEVVRLKKK